MWDGVCLVGTQLIDAHGSHWHAAGARPILVSKQLVLVFDFVVSVVVVFVLFGTPKSDTREDFVLCLKVFVSVFFLLLLLLLLSSCLEVQKSDATEVIDMQEALEVSPTECYSSSVCVWPKVEGSQPHPTLFLNTDLLLTDASVRRAQLVLTIGSSQGGWSPCRGNIMIHECSECPDSCFSYPCW